MTAATTSATVSVRLRFSCMLQTKMQDPSLIRHLTENPELIVRIRDRDASPPASSVKKSDT